MSDISGFGQAAVVVAVIGFVAVLLRLLVGRGWSELARLPLGEEALAVSEGEASA